MKKWKRALLVALPFTVLLSFQAFAGQWKQDMNGWWYENDDGSWMAGGWHWLDGNKDGIAECYYLNRDGYLVKDIGYVDGYHVDGNGAWMVDGKVQTKQVEVPAEASRPLENTEAPETPAVNLTDGEVIYLAAVEKNNALDQVDSEIELELTETSGNLSLSMEVKCNWKARGLKIGNLQYVSSGNVSMFGVTVPINEFYTDGYYYAESSRKYKQPMSVEDALDKAFAGTAHILSEDDLDDVSSIEVKQDGENKILYITLKVSDADELWGTGYDMKINTAVMEMIINKDGYCTAQLIHVDMDEVSSMDGDVSNLKLTARMKLNNPGQPVEFGIPSTAGFEEIYSLH